MPALVKSRVWSPAGTSDDDGTRVCPFRSKYLRKASRTSAPFMGWSLYHPGASVLGGHPRALAHDARDEIGHRLVDDLGGRATTAQPRGQLRARPRVAGEQVARREAGGLGVEDFAGRYDLSGAGALSPSVSRILASRSTSTAAFSCSHFRALSRPWPMRSFL